MFSQCHINKETINFKDMKKILIIILILWCNALLAQKAPMKWGKLTDKEIRMNAYEYDYNAPAVILCDYGSYTFDTHENHLRLMFTRHVRIKVFTDLPAKYSNVSVTYFGKEQFEEVITFKGQTFNVLPSGHIEKHKVRNRDIINEDVSKEGLKRKKMSLPNVKPGSIIEYTYTIASLNFKNPRKWYFQTDIPVIYSEFLMRSPSPFQYYFAISGDETPKINEQTENSQLVAFKYYYYGRARSMSVPIMGKQYRIVYEHLPALIKDSHRTTMKDYCTNVEFHLAKVDRMNNDMSQRVWEYLTLPLLVTTQDDFSPMPNSWYYNERYPAGFYPYALPSWKDFANELMRTKYFGKPFMKYWGYADIVIDITDGMNDKKQQMITIYNFVKDNLKWNGKYSIAVKEDLSEVYEAKSGNGTELNMMLTNMLINAGLDAYPVIISTRNHGRIEDLFPVIQQFNHLIVSVTIDENTYFLDATDPLRPYYLLDENDLNGKGYLVSRVAPKWVEIENPVEHKSIKEVNFKIDSNGLASGTIKGTETGYFAYNKRKEIIETGEVQYMDDCIKIFPGMVDDLYIENLNALDSNLITNIEFTSDKLVSSKDGHFEVDVLEKMLPFENPFTLAQRFYPVDFAYPYEKSARMIIEIPEGFEAELVTKDKDIRLLGEKAVYKLQLQQDKHKVTIFASLKIIKTKYQADYYEYVKEFFDEIKRANKAVIVLKKKA